MVSLPWQALVIHVSSGLSVVSPIKDNASTACPSTSRTSDCNSSEFLNAIVSFPLSAFTYGTLLTLELLGAHLLKITIPSPWVIASIKPAYIIVDPWVCIRGFSQATAWIERYKSAQKKNLQKAKALRKKTEYLDPEVYVCLNLYGFYTLARIARVNLSTFQSLSLALPRACTNVCQTDVQDGIFS